MRAGLNLTLSGKISIYDPRTDVTYWIEQHKRFVKNERYYKSEYQITADNGYNSFEGEKKIHTLSGALREIELIVKQERYDQDLEDN